MGKDKKTKRAPKPPQRKRHIRKVTPVPVGEVIQRLSHMLERRSWDVELPKFKEPVYFVVCANYVSALVLIVETLRSFGNHYILVNDASKSPLSQKLEKNPSPITCTVFEPKDEALSGKVAEALGPETAAVIYETQLELLPPEDIKWLGIDCRSSPHNRRLLVLARNKMLGRRENPFEWFVDVVVSPFDDSPNSPAYIAISHSLILIERFSSIVFDLYRIQELTGIGLGIVEQWLSKKLLERAHQ